MVSIVQNFICNKQERLQVIKRNTKKMGEVFCDYDFFINFNDLNNLEEVRESYVNNIPKLNFYNNLEKDWALITLAMVNEIKTPYVIYLCEDMEVNESKEFIDNFLQELIDNDGDLGFFSKIGKYLEQEFIDGFTPYNSIPSPGYKKMKYSYFYLGKHAPHKRVPVDAIFKTKWLKESLEEFLLYGEKCTHDIPFRQKYLPNFYEGYYDFGNGMRRFGDWKCFIPQKVIFKEFNDVKDKY